MGRTRLPEDLHVKVAGRLTERDLWLCEMLFQHRVLTTNNICDLAFDNLTTARHRLSELHALRLVDRFRPWRVAGSAPLHYVLDEMGAEVVAATRGVEREQLPLAGAVARHRHAPAPRRPGGVNSFFTALVRSGRQIADHRLRLDAPSVRCPNSALRRHL